METPALPQSPPLGWAWPEPRLAHTSLLLTEATITVPLVTEHFTLCLPRRLYRHCFAWSSHQHCEVATITVPISQQRKLRPRSHGKLESRSPPPPEVTRAASLSPRQVKVGKKSQVPPEIYSWNWRRWAGSIFPKSIGLPES